MREIYRIIENGESLTAVVNENSQEERKELGIEEWSKDISKFRIDLHYKDQKGNNMMISLVNGCRMDCLYDSLQGLSLVIGKKFTTDYISALERLGPELRELIPDEWGNVLGDWLKPAKKDKKTQE